jgi:hypothetical protein
MYTPHGFRQSPAKICTFFVIEKVLVLCIRSVMVNENTPLDFVNPNAFHVNRAKYYKFNLK